MSTYYKNPLIILTVCGLLLLPLTELTGLTTTTASEILIYAIAALGFNILLGYTGLVSFGHGIFFGVAAYAASIIQVKLMPGFIMKPTEYFWKKIHKLGIKSRTPVKYRYRGILKVILMLSQFL